MATIVDGKKRIPFMRGMLVSHLIQRGFDHQDAYEIADAVRGALSKRKELPKKEIVGIVGEILEAGYGDHQLGDLLFWEQAPRSVTVDRKSGTRPFSKELLSHSIQASGLPPDRSYLVAKEIETRLIDERRELVSHQELEEMAIRTLAERHGQTYADRYLVWRTWADLEKPLIILIGGASGVGKTSLAVSLANVLDIPSVVATDDIRQIMRLTLAREFMPAIHTSSYMVWSEVGVDDSAGLDPVIAGFREQSKVLAVGIQAILSRHVEENAGVIIDGVHLLPGFYDLTPYREQAFIAPVCLALAGRDAYEERFAGRAAEAPSRAVHQYVSHLDEILKVQSDIVDWCADEDIPVIDPDSVEDVTSAAVMVVMEQLQEQEEVRKILAPPGKKKGRKKGSLGQ